MALWLGYLRSCTSKALFDAMRPLTANYSSIAKVTDPSEIVVEKLDGDLKGNNAD